MRELAVKVLTRRPLLWLLVLGVLTAVLSPFVLQVPFVFEITEMFATDDPAVAPTERFRKLFGRDDNLVVVAWPDENIYSVRGVRKIKRVCDAISEFPGVDDMLSLTSAKEIRGTAGGFGLEPLLDMDHLEGVDFAALQKHLNEDPLWRRLLVGVDGDATAIVVRLEDEINTDEGRKAFFTALDELIAREGGEFHLGGVPVIRTAFVEYMKHDVRMFIPLTIILCMFLTYLLYRHMRPVILIFVINVVTVIWTFAAMGLGEGSVNIITIALPTLLMVMSTSYGVHFIGRYIEELFHGLDRDNAVRSTLRHMVLAILMTSVTTGVGFLSLLVMRVRLVRMFGIYAAVGMGIAFVVTIILLTTVLLKQKALSPKAVARFSEDSFRRVLLWNWRVVRRYKYQVAAISLLLAVVAVFGILRIKVDASLMTEINPKSKEYIANTFMEEHLAGVVSLSLLVRAEPDAFLQPDMLRKLDAVYEKALGWRLTDGSHAAEHGVAFSELIKVMNEAMHDGDPAYRRIPQFSEEEGGEQRARRAIAQYMLLYGDPDDFSSLLTSDYSSARVMLRLKDLGSTLFRPMEVELLEFARRQFGEGVEVEIVGESVMAGHIISRLVRDMTRSLLLAAFIIVIIFFVIFRSWRIGLLAMIPNILPLMVTMAALGYLGVTLRTSIVIVFSISLGIAVDDTIHFLARLRAESRAGKSLDEAIRATCLGTGRAIAFTSVILCSGFALLTFSQFLPAKNFGWLSALTMVTALIGDLFLLPALLYIFKPKIV